MKVNLWQETEAALKEHDIDFDRDVNNVVINGHLINKGDFMRLAERTNYEDVYATKFEINPTLMIVGGTWWMKRSSSPSQSIGSVEGWEFHRQPEVPVVYKEIKTLMNTKKYE